MDGAGNMAGKQKGSAARFTNQYPRAVYHCKSCNVKEVHVMLCSLKELGIFFKYSPKRSRRLEQAITTVNLDRSEDNKINKTKSKLFCETR
jgi:hypothetical protein